MSCEDVCQKFRVGYNPIYSPYDMGLVWCKICDIYMKKESCNKKGRLFCPCCGFQVRTKQKNKNRRKYIIMN